MNELCMLQYLPRPAIAIFAPTAEAIDDEDTFLSDSPLNLVQQGKFRPIPWLTGVLADEGLIFSAGKLYTFIIY